MRLSRPLLSIALLAALLPGPLAALDRGTSFSAGNVRGWIDPETGFIRLCEDYDGVLVPVSFSSFLFDLELLRFRPGKEVDGKAQNTLRQGAANWLPATADVLANFPAKPPKSAPDAKSYQALALKAEDEFWDKLPDYDGKATVAVQNPWLMIAIPGWHIVALYEVRDRNQPPLLTSWRNVGPDLMLPQGFKTTPAPQEVLNQLPAELRAAYGDAAKEAGSKTGGSKDPGKDSGKNTASGTLPPPIPGAFWITACGIKDTFVLTDPTNLRLVVYQVVGKTVVLKSARDCTIDMLIPTAFSKTGPKKSAAAPAAVSPLDQLVQRRKEELAEIHFTPDSEELEAFTETEGKPAKAAPAAGTASDQKDEDKGPDMRVHGNSVVIRDNARGKTASYRLDGADEKLEMVSMRDDSYSPPGSGIAPAGIALLEDFLAKRRFAHAAYDQARELKGQNESAFAMLRFALHLDPTLLPKMQDDLRLISLRRKPEWKAIVEGAEKDAAAALALRAARIKRAEELRAEAKEKAKHAKTP